MTKLSETTNATKGMLVVGAALVVQGLEVFDLHHFSADQQSWITAAVLFAGGAWIALTRKLSKKRVPDA